MFKFKKILTDYLYAAAGSFVLAFAISYFHAPFNISTGGVSGVAITLETLFKIPKPVSTLVINLVLFGFGFKTLKKSAILKTVIGIFMLSGFILAIDTTVIISSGFAFGDISLMFYSALSLYISTKVTDFILVRGDFAKSVYVISKKSTEIAAEIMKKWSAVLPVYTAKVVIATMTL